MPSWSNPQGPVTRVGLVLFERFSLHCLANAVEPLRAANMLGRRPAYDWRFLTLDGLPVKSSSGLEIAPHGRLGGDDGGDMLFVMPSYDFRAHATPGCSRALRAAALRYPTIVGFDTGSWLMAEAGLLHGRAATIHWEELAGFAEHFPEVIVRRERHVIDGDRITCSGAMAAYDLVTELIGRRQGEALRLEVTDLLMTGGSSRAGASRDRMVDRALAIMRESVEAPLSIAQIARRVGRTQRTLEARMRLVLGATPQTVYRRLRLNLARKLAEESALPVAEIAIRCGYTDASAMARAFRAEFGLSIRQLRGA
jgi:transcriptional regulator GlxA family with amidase domain